MTPGGKRVVLVAAVADNGVIGDGPDIPWRVPGEQATFKELTLGHVLVMGRTTYESIGRPLPGRTTIVLTRDPAWTPGHDEVRVAHSVEDALRLADSLPGDVMVAGGAAVYAAALAAADEQVLSRIPLSPPATSTTRRTTRGSGSRPPARPSPATTASTSDAPRSSLRRRPRLRAPGRFGGGFVARWRSHLNHRKGGVLDGG